MNILVTGASGLVGQHLLAALTQLGHKVRATYRQQIPYFFTLFDTNAVEWIQCDVTNISSMELAFENITHVYHCAAIVSYDPRMKAQMMETNIEGTANVVNLCLDYKIEKLCYVSSIATLGEPAIHQLINEKDDFDEHGKNSNYSVSKHAAEMEVWRGVAEGLNAVIINPGIILGEGDDNKSSSHLFKIVQNEFAYYTLGSTAWVDAKDVAKIMILLMQSEVSNQRFIVSEGNHSYKDIFTMMANAMNKKAPHTLAKPWMTNLVWRYYYLKSMLTGKMATITKETAQSAQTIRQFDNLKLLKMLPNFKYIPIKESIQRIVQHLYL